MNARAAVAGFSLVAALVMPGWAASANPNAPVGPVSVEESAAGSTAARPSRPAVIGHRVIGRSVRGRAIHAWHLGDPKAKRTAVVMSTMHGNEADTRHILRALRDGAKVKGINLWLIPTYNPDGWVGRTRKNAHGVDLNRNFPYSWRNLDGNYESGPRPGSEPETRAVMRFLRKVKPLWLVSFHQPLYGVDVDTKNKALARRLAKELQLPRKSFTCGGVCHGTMTGWYNHNFRGAALTVEFNAHPTKKRLMTQAPRQLLRALRARR